MNRTAVGLAVGAGYVLGRTKKMKLAFAVGTMVAGKKLQLSPKAVVDLVRTQLDKNPQFQEIGGQLRNDFRGVGKAATGAILERQMEGLANRLHSSTTGVRDRLQGGSADSDGADDADDVEDSAESADPETEGKAGARKPRTDNKRDDDRDDEQDGNDASAQDEERPAPRKRAPVKKSAPSGRRKPEQGTRTQGTAAKKSASSRTKKATGAARRSPSSGAKGGRNNG
ncbi:DNA primase [Streptomyces sp. NPDC050264]|uniref:DNA primase n=1 Tax=Streptomyces sp. NPDC050264 TaxID=3155038 RepID=UPI0034342A6D